MTTVFWDWRPAAGGGHELFKEGRRVFRLDDAGVIRDLATPAGVVVGDVTLPAAPVRFTCTAYIATLETETVRIRVRSGDRITRVDLTAPAADFRPAPGFELPAATGTPYRTARTGQAGVCVMEIAAARSICAFDDPGSFDPALAFAAFAATALPRAADPSRAA